MFFAIPLLIVLFVSPLIDGHARLKEPPARTSAHLLGFPNVPADYNDMGQHCGGYDHMLQTGGKCGICGDPFDDNPRRSERPNGPFATNTIVRTYKSGAIIDAEVEFGANHLGWNWFKICSAPNPDVEVTQACLDSHPIEILEAPGGKIINKYGWAIHDELQKQNGIFKFKLQLPKGLTCDRCVMQWDWLCGNRYGKCNNGTMAMGCGVQEVFRGCADVKIQ